jgi:hypothetical protein
VGFSQRKVDVLTSYPFQMSFEILCQNSINENLPERLWVYRVMQERGLSREVDLNHGEMCLAGQDFAGTLQDSSVVFFTQFTQTFSYSRSFTPSYFLICDATGKEILSPLYFPAKHNKRYKHWLKGRQIILLQAV